MRKDAHMKNYTIDILNGQIAMVTAQTAIIDSGATALDLFMQIAYGGCTRIAINKEGFSEDFFVLRTRLAGEVLQKVSNYRLQLAIYGDFSGLQSKALKDFIYECNSGSHVFFVESKEEAIERLSKGI